MSGITRLIISQICLLALSVIPKNALSRLTGGISQCSWSAKIIPWFVEKYSISLEEVELPLDSYENLHSFFIRDLKEGARIIEDIASGKELAIVSPADGMLTQCGEIESGTLLQVKGKYYQVADLLSSATEAAAFQSGSYFTIYLAPGDYHHVHSPCSGKVDSLKLIPGTLWPVNSWSVNSIDRLFCKNERMIIGLTASDVLLKVVMVGATNVGKISLTFDDLISNSKNREITTKVYNYGCEKKAGARLGTFHLGSTVVVLINKKLSGNRELGRIKYGQLIGGVL